MHALASIAGAGHRRFRLRAPGHDGVGLTQKHTAAHRNAAIRQTKAPRSPITAFRDDDRPLPPELLRAPMTDFCGQGISIPSRPSYCYKPPLNR